MPDPLDIAGRAVAVPAFDRAVEGAVGLRPVVLLSGGASSVMVSVVAGSVGGRIDGRVADVDGPVESVIGGELASELAETGGIDWGAVLGRIDWGAVLGGIDCGAEVCDTMMLAPAVPFGAVPFGAVPFGAVLFGAVLVGPVSGGPLLIADDTTGAVGVGPAGSASVLQAASNATIPTASASARTDLRR